MNNPESYQTKSINNKSHLEYTVIDIDKLFQPPKEYLFFQFENDILNQNIKTLTKEESIAILRNNSEVNRNARKVFLIRSFRMIIPLFEYYLKAIEEYGSVGQADIFIERYEQLLQEFKSISNN